VKIVMHLATPEATEYLRTMQVAYLGFRERKYAYLHYTLGGPVTLCGYAGSGDITSDNHIIRSLFDLFLAAHVSADEWCPTCSLLHAVDGESLGAKVV